MEVVAFELGLEVERQQGQSRRTEQWHVHCERVSGMCSEKRKGSLWAGTQHRSHRRPGLRGRRAS